MTSEEKLNQTWYTEDPCFCPDPNIKSEAISVKDPTVVFYDGKYHILYTTRGFGVDGQERYSLGYVSAPNLEELNSTETKRYNFDHFHEFASYIAAPQVFYYTPHKKWYLVFQAKTPSLYTPIYSTNHDINDPEGWTYPKVLVKKFERAKWIDFWIICDDESAYLFYTRNHKEMYYMTTKLSNFPKGFSKPRKCKTTDKSKIVIHEACMVYKVKDKQKYLLIIENYDKENIREFYMSTAESLKGPWTPSELIATGSDLIFNNPENKWTDMISHGEFIRSGYDQYLEIESEKIIEFLIQGATKDEYSSNVYEKVPWKLGLIRNFLFT